MAREGGGPCAVTLVRAIGEGGGGGGGGAGRAVVSTRGLSFRKLDHLAASKSPPNVLDRA